MIGSLNSFSILALFGDEAARDILQEVVTDPDIKLDFFSGKLSEPLSTILSAENYDLIFLDKSIEPGIEGLLEIISAEQRFIPVILLGREGDNELKILNKGIWDYCEIKDIPKLKRFVSNFRKLKFAKSKDSGISDYFTIRGQYADLITENAKEGILITQDGKFKYADPQIFNFHKLVIYD